jgi:hypothetical protein
LKSAEEESPQSADERDQSTPVTIPRHGRASQPADPDSEQGNHARAEQIISI